MRSGASVNISSNLEISSSIVRSWTASSEISVAPIWDLDLLFLRRSLTRGGFSGLRLAKGENEDGGDAKDDQRKAESEALHEGGLEAAFWRGQASW